MNIIQTKKQFENSSLYLSNTHPWDRRPRSETCWFDTRNVYPVGREISNSHAIASVRNAVRTAVLWLTIRDVPVCEKQTEKGRTWTPLHKTPNMASLRHVQNTNLEILYGGCTECLEEGKLQEEVNKGTFDASTAEEQYEDTSQGNVLARRATCKDLTRQGLL